MELMEHQKEALNHLSNGKILWGGVGTGKSATALAYYVQSESPKDIVVITTAKKRDSLDWEREAANFAISVDPEATADGALIVESWNNVGKFTDYEGYFFIFDEQRVVGRGSWVKAFIKIAKKNSWILLSATPGDTWLDYIPVFVANGWYKNRTEFMRKHVVLEPFSKYPKVRGYINPEKLQLLRNEVLVEMPYETHTERHLNWLELDFDKEDWKAVYNKRWNPFDEKPIKDVAELFRLMRKVVNRDRSRLDMLKELMKVHDRLVVFYNFDYELEILRTLYDSVEVGEWNGHQKDLIPTTEKWVYLVQYTAGSEGWNCTETDAEVFYSLTYSYKQFEQAQGRIDRLDTPFADLYYYIFTSNSVIDRGIRDSLASKKSFNEKRFAAGMSEMEQFNGNFDSGFELPFRI